MTARDSNLYNAFETTLSSGMGDSDLTATVASTSGMTSPCYLVIDPDDPAKREYVYFDGTFTATTFVSSNIANRYLGGSAAGSGISHSSGAVVRCSPLAQHFEDLHDRIDGLGDPILETLVDAKGDLIVGSAADTAIRKAVGANDTVLVADSAQAGGVKWAQIPTAAIADDAVTAAKVADGAIDATAKLAADVVTTAKILDSNVTTGKIADDNVTDAKLAAGLRYDSLVGFVRVNVAAGLTAVQLGRSTKDNGDFVLPVVVDRAGSIIGVSVASAEARSAGTLTVEVYKNGVATGLTAVIDGTNTQYGYGTQAVGSDTFTARDRLDVRVTTDGTWAPTTADIEAKITVGYD